ncbi:MAG: amidohydrolase [Chloroflexi bacterium]|nr:amidohydrolase [Chloroflexota bacterium]
MIIDADVHISPTPEGGNSITSDELLRRMDYAGVDRALTWLQPPYKREIAAANRYVYDAMQAHPDRILGFGWVDPHLGLDRMRDELKRCVEEYGLYGVKLNGAQNNFYIDDPELSLPLAEAIAATGTVLAFHIGTDAYEATHPFRLGKIAARFPETRILMVHMGGVGFHDLSNAAIEVLQAHSNITGIGTAMRHINIQKIIRAVGADRVCFGSDAPFALMHVEGAAYQALLQDGFSESEQAAVMGGNIARVLGVGL